MLKIDRVSKSFNVRPTGKKSAPAPVATPKVAEVV